MDTFQIVVLGIASVVLLIIFTTVGVLMAYSSKIVYPPTINTCPDYWQ